MTGTEVTGSAVIDTGTVVEVGGSAVVLVTTGTEMGTVELVVMTTTTDVVVLTGALPTESAGKPFATASQIWTMSPMSSALQMPW